MQPTSPTAILLISCPDRTGLVAAVTRFILEHNGNIVALDQHVDIEEGVFFMRVEWTLDSLDIPGDAISARFNAEVAAPLKMQFALHFSDHAERMAIFVSKQGHCLYDLLSRWQSGEWRVHIPLIISNHQDLEPVARQFGVEFRYFPINAGNKREMEDKQLALLSVVKPDFIVLARYMQIVSPKFVEQFPNRLINIHHSFLPAFIGAKPYHAAYGRGVKIIGATSHYVTAELDAGPIIEQDVIRVNHKDSVDELIRKGKDVEKLVLSRAVLYHLRKQVLIYKNKTVVFG
ncbi:MAG: formyltetrahydrofolate deformylase [Anaerolineae bacterium]|nr:formyltetrahydrofolate deformylase [Anaerolineae bacterium]